MPKQPYHTTEEAAADARIMARQHGFVSEIGFGLHELGLDDGRDGLIYVPESYARGTPAPLMVTLHGAGANAEQALMPLRGLADSAGIVLLAPSSRRGTWDVIMGGYGPDVEFIDRSLRYTFGAVSVDTSRIALEGFSDGASYALSLGICNGDRFTHVIAFSPGFMAPPRQVGAPRIYVSHGLHDDVLPIERCSQRLVPQLERAGYDVTYHQFDGGHVVPPDIAREAIAWFVDRGGSA